MTAEQGFKISYNHAFYNNTKNILVEGVLSTFVNCGSQYSTWRQFPMAIRYTVKNLDTGDIYNSIDMQLSISESGNEIFERYSKEPCGTVVSQDFSVSLNEIFFQSERKTKVLNFELQAEYAGHTSNILLFKNIPFELKNFL